MARITATTNDRVFSLQKWMGLNEHPDGDTRLKLGEASRMVNWRVTRDGNLKLRPGQEFVLGLGPEYGLEIGHELREVGVYQATDILFVSEEVSATARLGTLTMTGGDIGTIDSGRIVQPNATVENGRYVPAGNSWSVVDGVLATEAPAGQTVTPDVLAQRLAALGDGEYIYYQVSGATYALPNNGIALKDDGYHLYGLLATAEAVGDPKPISALWSGKMGGKDVLLAACDGGIYSLYNADEDVLEATKIGDAATDKGVHFFQFDGIVYLLNGYEYYKYDGVNFVTVHGYRPLVALSIGPQGTGDAGELTSEYVNRLNAERRVWISPDGSTNPTFQLPEKNIASIDKVINLSTNNIVDATTGYTADLVAGTITFNGTMPKAVNSYEIQYSAQSDYRSQVTSMLFSEFYSGTTDTRIFLYGDGSNKTIYSGMDYDGVPRADYFPDQYEVAIGDANEPITSMIRHGGALIAYKPRECWSLQHGVVELATGDLTPSIYTTPVNRERGNEAIGQVRLVDNSPITVSGTELYRWGSVSRYSSAIGRDERNAQRISDRIQTSIKELNFKTVRMWDDNDHQEFYLCGENMALVWNYSRDCWYRYENFDATAICSFHGDLYIGSHDGKIRRMSDYVVGDDGIEIVADWESGAIDFGAAYSRKYSAALWIGMKPIEGTSVNVTVETDRKNTFHEKVVASTKAKVLGQPFMARSKIKAKKFVFYRLILRVNKRMLPTTITNVEIRVRMTSDAK